MSLTPPPLRSGSVPATASAMAGVGGAKPLPPHPPAGSRFPLRVSARLAVMIASVVACDRATPAPHETSPVNASSAQASQPQRSAPVSDAGAATTFLGTYKSEPAALYIPAAPDWKGVRWAVKETPLGIGEGAITMTIDAATGRVTGAVEGPLGPGVLAGVAREGNLTATIVRKDPSDRGFTGTLMASVKSGHADGTMSVSLAEASAIRQASFALLAMDSAQPPR